MNTPHDDPDARDAWLSEALRHAPDADAAPPPRVNDTILRMGRAAVATRAPRAAPPPPTWLDQLGAAWSWLARPPVAAGFATVMVATVVGLMWWDRPLDESLPPREAAVAAAPAATTAEPSAVAAPAAEQAKPAVPVARTATLSKSVETLSRKAAPATAAAPAAAPPPPTPAPAPAPPRDMAAAKSAGAGAGVAAQDEAPDQLRARVRESAERRELAAAPVAPAAPPATQPAQAMGRMADAAAPAALAGRAAVASSPIETPGLSNLRFEIRRKPESWTWQRDDGAPRQVDDSFEAWIAQADRTARAQWQAGAAGSDTVSTTLRFTRDGVVRAILRLGPAGMHLTRGGKTESAELARGQAAALLAALDALGP